MPEPLELKCPPGGANRDGAFKLSWTGPKDATFRLVEKQGDQSRTLFEGRSHGSTVAGRPAGDYQYSLSTVQGRSATPCVVKVRPYPLTLALSFFFVGSLVTLATVIVILRGHRAHKRGEIG